jgi:hypothetical protein
LCRFWLAHPLGTDRADSRFALPGLLMTVFSLSINLPSLLKKSLDSLKTI